MLFIYFFPLAIQLFPETFHIVSTLCSHFQCELRRVEKKYYVSNIFSQTVSRIIFLTNIDYLHLEWSIARLQYLRWYFHDASNLSQLFSLTTTMRVLQRASFRHIAILLWLSLIAYRMCHWNWLFLQSLNAIHFFGMS